jgi:hypothetical protein
MTVQVFSPQISVILRKNIGRATVAGTIAASQRFQGTARTLDLTPYLGETGAVVVSKNVRDAMGTWSVTLADDLAPGQLESLYGVIEPMDVVEIRMARDAGVDVYHGVKVYLGLDTEQRLDVQLISNTNIATSGDLFDRMHETAKGPELRNWCQAVDFLEAKQDFTDSRQRGGAVSVQLACTFIMNYYEGRKIDAKKFDATETTPVLCPRGQHDQAWEALRAKMPGMWKDTGLRIAGAQFASLAKTQRAAFASKKVRGAPDFPEKAMNLAVLSAWAYVAGVLHSNDARLKRHFALAGTTGRDPLNAAALAKGRHKTDPENYRGLGYRTDTRERGRLVELFFSKRRKGTGSIPLWLMQLLSSLKPSAHSLRP